MVLFCEKCGKAILPSQIKKYTTKIRCVCGNLILVSAENYLEGKGKSIISSKLKLIDKIDHIPETCPRCDNRLLLRESDECYLIECANQDICDFKGKLESLEECSCPLCERDLAFYKVKRKMVLGCSGYPICKFLIEADIENTNKKVKKAKSRRESEEIIEKIPRECPDCGSTLQLRRGSYGVFLGCRSYPSCQYIFKIQDPDDIHCPLCGSYMITKKGKYGHFLGCSSYPTCRFTIAISKKY